MVLFFLAPPLLEEALTELLLLLTSMAVVGAPEEEDPPPLVDPAPAPDSTASGYPPSALGDEHRDKYVRVNWTYMRMGSAAEALPWLQVPSRRSTRRREWTSACLNCSA